MDGNQIDTLVSVNLPISYGDLVRIQDVIQAESPFSTSFPNEDVHSVMFYHGQSGVHDTKVCMLLDRNVFGRIIDLARGGEASSEHRLPAAILAFAQCADILIEPTLALSEGIATQPLSKKAERDLALFRAADDLHPQELVDIALGRARALKTKLDVAGVSLDADRMSIRLKHYGIAYSPMLKMGLLELEGGPLVQRMRRFLEWMHAEWFWSAPATLFAGICFSGNRPSGLMKGIHDQDRSLALRGLRNATWDLVYVGYWGELMRRQSREKKLWILCSLDKSLRGIANRLLTHVEDPVEELREYFRDLLGQKNGGEIYECYQWLQARKDDPARAIVRLSGSELLEYKRQTEAALEAEVLAV